MTPRAPIPQSWRWRTPVLICVGLGLLGAGGLLIALMGTADAPPGQQDAATTSAGLNEETPRSLAAYSDQIAQIQPILTLIGTYESQGNYNAYYGNQDNQSDPEFTSMSLSEVLSWQRDYINAGSVSSAVGKYQIIDKTITKLAPSIPLTMEAVFANETQDVFALKILEANGLDAFLDGRLSVDAFGTNLAREWSSLPVLTRVGRVRAGEGYYGGHIRLRTSEFRDVLTRVAGPHDAGAPHRRQPDHGQHQAQRDHAQQRARGQHVPEHHGSQAPHRTARTHHEEERRQKSRGAAHAEHIKHKTHR